jgi:hypothetical protein
MDITRVSAALFAAIALTSFAQGEDSKPLSATKLKAKLVALPDDEYDELIASLPTETVAENAEGLVKAAQFNVLGKIIKITELEGDLEGTSAVVLSTATGASLAFVMTDRQVGSAIDTKGFGIDLGSTYDFTLEKRIGGVTQFINKANLPEYHKKTAYGFVSAIATDSDAFMVSQINAVPDTKTNAVTDALVRMRIARMQIGMIG